MADIIQTLQLKDDPTTKVFPRIKSDGIPSGAVTTDKIDASAVTTAKVADGAITEGKLSSGAVTEGKLASGAVTHEKLTSGAVEGSNIAEETITGFNLDMGCVSHYNLNLSYVMLASLLLDEGQATTLQLASARLFNLLTNQDQGRGFLLRAYYSDGNIVNDVCFSVDSTNYVIKFWLADDPTNITTITDSNIFQVAINYGRYIRFDFIKWSAA